MKKVVYPMELLIEIKLNTQETPVQELLAEKEALTETILLSKPEFHQKKESTQVLSTLLTGANPSTMMMEMTLLSTVTLWKSITLMKSPKTYSTPVKDSTRFQTSSQMTQEIIST